MAVTLKTMITDWLRIKTQSGTPATPASGYSIIYEEGGALKLKDDAGTITTFGGSTVSDAAYGAGWNGVTTISPSKNAVYDKIQTLTGVAVVQIVQSQSATYTSGTTTIPLDDTIPQNTEGTEFLTCTITPTSATNILYIDALLNLVHNGVLVTTTALFQDSTANAIFASTNTPAGNNYLFPGIIKYKMVAGTTSATTFKIRAGTNTAGTVSMNGTTSARVFGGVLISSMTITEAIP